MTQDHVDGSRVIITGDGGKGRVAVGNLETLTIRIRVRAHGRAYQRDIALGSLVDMLDPNGTSFRSVTVEEA